MLKKNEREKEKYRKRMCLPGGFDLDGPIHPLLIFHILHWWE